MSFSFRFRNVLVIDGQLPSLQLLGIQALLDGAEEVPELETALDFLRGNWPEGMESVWLVPIGESNAIFLDYLPTTMQIAAVPALYLRFCDLPSYVADLGFESEVRHASCSEMDGYWLCVRKPLPFDQRIAAALNLIETIPAGLAPLPETVVAWREKCALRINRLSDSLKLPDPPLEEMADELDSLGVDLNEFLDQLEDRVGRDGSAEISPEQATEEIAILELTMLISALMGEVMRVLYPDID